MAKFKISKKFTSVTIPGVGVVHGDRVLAGAEYEKYVGLGLLEVFTGPDPVAAPAAPPPVGRAPEPPPVKAEQEVATESAEKTEQAEADVSESRPAARKPGPRR